MNFRPTVIEGSVIDLPIDPRVALRFVTNTPGGRGKPIKKRVKHIPVENPLISGEEMRHKELLSVIKGLNVTQTVSQSQTNVEEALKQNRDWRG